MSFKIVCTGPESSGKSTLVECVAKELNWPWVEEIARNYLSNTQGYYDESALIEMAITQFVHISTYEAQYPHFLCDTDLLTYMIWQEEKYGHIDIFIKNLWLKQLPTAYILCSPDIIWEPDPLRENPFDRDRLFLKYESMLKLSGVPFFIVSGNQASRVELAIKFIDSMSKLNI